MPQIVIQLKVSSGVPKQIMYNESSQQVHAQIQMSRGKIWILMPLVFPFCLLSFSTMFPLRENKVPHSQIWHLTQVCPPWNSHNVNLCSLLHFTENQQAEKWPLTFIQSVCLWQTNSHHRAITSTAPCFVLLDNNYMFNEDTWKAETVIQSSSAVSENVIKDKLESEKFYCASEKHQLKTAVMFGLGVVIPSFHIKRGSVCWREMVCLSPHSWTMRWVLWSYPLLCSTMGMIRPHFTGREKKGTQPRVGRFWISLQYIINLRLYLIFSYLPTMVFIHII